ncbi:CpaE family protein [Litorimonas sp. RW-G-Af-16]
MTQPQMPHPQAPRPVAPQPQAQAGQAPANMGAPRPLAMPTSPVPMPAAPMPAAPQPMPMQAAPAPMPVAPMPSPMQTAPQAQPHQPQPQQQQVVPQMPTMEAAPLGETLPVQDDIEGLSREGGERALPQIAIHAFCDRQETAHCINETTRDWRMKRTNMKIYMGGLQAAVEFYHKENTPGLILIETGMRGQELFSQLEELASVCDAGTKVVVIGATNDIRLYRQLMEKGVSEYLVPPLHPLNVIRALGDLYADPEQPFIGRVAAFFGAKGGVGSSTLAHNVAWILSEQMAQETALVDLDASWGTTGLDFAYDSTSGLEEALAEPDRLDETLLDRIMIRHTPKLSILPTSGSLNMKPVLDSAAYEAVVSAVRGISPLAILDMPHFWTDWTTNVLSSVDDVVITATPDLANLRNTKNLIDFLKTQRPNDPDPIFILNKTGASKLGEISVKDFATAVGLEPSLVIGFDPDSFFEVTNEGKMLSDVKNAQQTVQGLAYIANRLKTGSFEQRKKVAEPIGKKGKRGKSGDKPAKESKPLFSFMKKKG